MALFVGTAMTKFLESASLGALRAHFEELRKTLAACDGSSNAQVQFWMNPGIKRLADDPASGFVSPADAAQKIYDSCVLRKGRFGLNVAPVAGASVDIARAKLREQWLIQVYLTRIPHVDVNLVKVTSDGSIRPPDLEEELCNFYLGSNVAEVVRMTQDGPLLGSTLDLYVFRKISLVSSLKRLYLKERGIDKPSAIADFVRGTTNVLDSDQISRIDLVHTGRGSESRKLIEDCDAQLMKAWGRVRFEEELGKFSVKLNSWQKAI